MPLLRRHFSPQPPIQPPAPHDPSARACLSDVGDWSLWSTPRNIPNYTQIVRSGQLHMQLWHAGANISILTPSSSTNHHYELWTPNLRMRICCYQHVAEKLAEFRGPLLPCPNIISHFAAWFIHAPMLGLVIGQEAS